MFITKINEICNTCIVTGDHVYTAKWNFVSHAWTKHRTKTMGTFSLFFLSSSLAVYLLRLQEELLLFVLRAAGEPAHLCHVSPVKGDRISAAEAHAFAGPGPATVLAAPQHPEWHLQGKRRLGRLGPLSPGNRGGRGARHRQPPLTLLVHANAFDHTVHFGAVCFCCLTGGAAQQER